MIIGSIMYELINQNLFSVVCVLISDVLKENCLFVKVINQTSKLIFGHIYFTGVAFIVADVLFCRVVYENLGFSNC